MLIERQNGKVSTVEKVLWTGILALVLLLQFRLLSFCITVAFAVVLTLLPNLRRRRFIIPAAAIVAISLFLPFDIAIGGYHFGSRRATSPRGPHFVRFVVGMPMHTRLIQTYGEYISAGCAWPSIFPPKSVLVWD